MRCEVYSLRLDHQDHVSQVANGGDGQVREYPPLPEITVIHQRCHQQIAIAVRCSSMM